MASLSRLIVRRRSAAAIFMCYLQYITCQFFILFSPLPLSDIHLVTYGPASFIIPKDPSKRIEIYAKLENAHPNMTVYLKENIPERFHYKNHRRITPIFAIADLGWWVHTHSMLVCNCACARVVLPYLGDKMVGLAKDIVQCS